MAKYDLKSSFKVELAEKRLKTLIEKKAMIELKELRMPHSVDAQRLYRGVWLPCIAKETGRIADELHYLYRATFLPKPEERILKILQPGLWIKIKRRIENFEYFPGMNEVINVISYSTAIYINGAMDSKEFWEYLKKIQNHARVNFDVILLTLEDKHFEEFYREYGFH